MSKWLIYLGLGAKFGLGVLMLAHVVEGTNPVASLLSGSMCALRLSWIIAGRLIPDV